MSKLDDKIKDIVSDQENYTSYPDSFNNRGTEQIKQAFTDEGYVYHAQSDSFKTTTLRMGLMSGQEWYDRFKKELNKRLPQRVPEYFDALESAKKATGLE